MTGHLAEIGERIAGIRQLGSVVTAMRGIAAARRQRASDQLAAVEAFSAILAAAIGRALALVAPDAPSLRTGSDRNDPGRLAIVVFGAEQGFAGAFSERVLDAAGPDLATATVFMMGTRGAAVAVEHGHRLAWTGAMPSHSAGIPVMADRIAEALYRRIAEGKIDRLDTVFARWQPGQATAVARQRLFPLDAAAFASTALATAPLLNLAPANLLSALTEDYVHAQLCAAGLQAFASENQARMEAMAAAHAEIDRQLSLLKRQLQSVRQEEITAEIIELAGGEAI